MPEKVVSTHAAPGDATVLENFPLFCPKCKQETLIEEKVLRNYGTDESTIEQLRAYDREVFNSDRRFYQRVQETDTYLDTIAESEQTIDVKSVTNLLDEIENENLYRILLTVDKCTLQIVLLKMQGYSIKEIAPIVELTTGAVYKRLDTLRKKLKQFKE